MLRRATWAADYLLVIGETFSCLYLYRFGNVFEIVESEVVVTSETHGLYFFQYPGQGVVYITAELNVPVVELVVGAMFTDEAG